jgi:hypothetical protein
MERTEWQQTLATDYFSLTALFDFIEYETFRDGYPDFQRWKDRQGASAISAARALRSVSRLERAGIQTAQRTS